MFAVCCCLTLRCRGVPISVEVKHHSIIGTLSRVSVSCGLSTELPKLHFPLGLNESPVMCFVFLISLYIIHLTLLSVTLFVWSPNIWNVVNIFCVIPFYLQSVLVHSANCVKTNTVSCGRVLNSAPL
jgi:hypothetical protein